ncbi:hypothetical protein JJB74_22060 [Noviherbaspirillum sp. DKR-6]|uniref:Uncharacterized protein n=2 Tax=Noviherbaspirillum pedocola TaxID=2801341 RepID=A0A934SXH4_9BURK|nr:hypothetical protein [Noviherbaspirillum pedocola]MBK4737313.1 hypothetical protein [Noviherbaspirillum pedocola]
MRKHGITDGLENERLCIFTLHYQFFREVIFSVEKNGTFVVLFDKRSPVFRCRAGEKEGGLLPFLLSYLPDSIKAKVVSLSMQELVAQIETRPAHHDWIFEFKRKYGMD